MKDFLYSALIVIFLSIAFAAALLFCTTDKMWYAGQHDSRCEKFAGKTACKCYNRFMAKAGE